MSQDSSTTFVKALYPFKGSNNDELVFKQGDIITITQKEEEGWCEGTLNGKTGWFPSNYVKEYKPEPSACTPTNIAEQTLKSREYRNEVLKDMIESETAHVQELSILFKTYLQPLKKSNLFDENFYHQLVGNYEQVLTIHTQLLHKLEESLGFIGKDQRVGSMFMQIAPNFKKIHLCYCSNHPKAALLLGEHKENLTKFVESLGVATASSLMTITTALSKPFRRLEKYQGLLQELERHTDESHIDRGDCQRAVTVYRDIAIACSDKRRQKEMELEVLIPGRIKDWEGDDISLLGDIIHMSQVSVYQSEPSKEPSAREKKDRYFVLFPQTLLMLSVSHRLSAFIYEGKLPLSGIAVQKSENSEVKNAFEIKGDMIEHITVSCSSRDDREAWVELLNDQICVCQMASTAASVCSNQTKTLPTFRNTMQDNLLLKSPSNSLASSLRNSMQNQKSSLGAPEFNPELKSPTLHPVIPPHRSPTPPLPMPYLNDNSAFRNPNQLPMKVPVHNNQSKSPVWTMSCLRPSPPRRPCINTNESHKKGSTKKKVEDRSYEDDMKILRVIEAYCTSAKTRNTVNSTLLDCPQVLIAEEEKMIVEEIKGNQMVVEERSLVDTMYALKDEVKELSLRTANLSSLLEDERRARLRLEGFIKKHLLNSHEDLCWDD